MISAGPRGVLGTLGLVLVLWGTAPAAAMDERTDKRAAATPDPIHQPVTLTQADGGLLTLPQSARRVITLSPHLAELVFQVGGGDQVLASVAYTDYPPAAAALPRVGDAFRIDLEQVLALNPDLVIAWASGNPDALLQRLQALGVPVWRTEVRDPQELARLIRELGLALGRRETAMAVAEDLDDRLQTLRARYGQRAEVSYFFQISPQPLYTVNGEHLISRLLSICGGRNIFADLGSLAPTVGEEAVIQADPQVILAARPGAETAAIDAPDSLQRWRRWPAMDAVSGGHLYHLPADEISRATLRALTGTEKACALLDRAR